MTLPSIIVLAELLLILIASNLFRGSGTLKTVPASEWAWAIILFFVLIAEVVLIVWKNHTLSGQMQWYVREHRLSGFFVIFWGWLAFHFVLEPAVRLVQSFLK